MTRGLNKGLLAVREWLRHDFFRISAVIFGLSTLSSLLNMIVRWLMCRMLTTEQYGEMETVLQAGSYIGVPISTLSIIMTREVAFARGEGQDVKLQAVIWTLGRLIVLYGIFGMLLLLALSPFIRDWFHFNSVWPVTAVSTLGVTGCLLVILQSALQGSHRFFHGGLMGLSGPLFKIVLFWILATAGYGATGAVAAHSLANALMGFVGLFFAWDLLFPRRFSGFLPLPPLFRFFIPITLTLWVSTVFSGVDIFFVKRVFSAVEAGNYARVSSLARLSFVITGMLALVLFPWVASEQAGGRSTRHLLVRSLIVSAGIALSAALAFTIMPRFLLLIFYPEVTADMIVWARMMGWALIPANLFGILLQYYMARQEYGFLKWFALATVGYVGLLAWVRHSIPHLILAIGFGSALLVVLLAIPALWPRSGNRWDKERSA